ncbi:MAG: hypothetical protein AVDCRST_MAG11-1221, partial [uncultured Gemmatimonadaceae bacterium]
WPGSAPKRTASCSRWSSRSSCSTPWRSASTTSRGWPPPAPARAPPSPRRGRSPTSRWSGSRCGASGASVGG